MKSTPAHLAIIAVAVLLAGPVARAQSRDIENDVFRNATLAKMKAHLESKFGVHVYHEEGVEHPLGSGGASSVMDALVEYYVWNVPSALDAAAEGQVFGRDSVWAENGRDLYQLVSGPKSIRNCNRGGESDVTPGLADIPASPFLYSTASGEVRWATAYKEHGLWGRSLCPSKAEQRAKVVFTTTGASLFEAPAPYLFYRSMVDSQTGQLPATIVFMSASIRQRDSASWSVKRDAYRAAYPTPTAILPIPQPILFVSSDADELELSQMIREEAPRVAAYSALYAANVLPSAVELERALAAYPDLLQSVESAAAQARAFNRREALFNAFLRVLTDMSRTAPAPFKIVGNAIEDGAGGRIDVRFGNFVSNVTYRNLIIQQIQIVH